MAEIIGVARPLLRETLHRLANEGWLTIAHGKPTQVNDYWEKGGMGVLSTLAKYIDTLPAGFVIHLMDVRSRLLPIIAGLAVAQAPDKVHTFLASAGEIDDDVSAFVDFDWQFQLFLATQSRNPIYKPILNDFSAMFEALATAYFSLPEARTASRQYYRDLSTAIQAGRRRVETVVMEAMVQSNTLWSEILYAAANEKVHHLSDLLLRRVRTGLLTEAGGRDHFDRIRHLCAPVLGWDLARWKKEISNYLEIWRFAHGMPGKYADSRRTLKSFFLNVGNRLRRHFA